MNVQKLIDRFNEPDVNLVISEWPSRSSSVSHHGVADYTRETLVTLARDRNMRFVVLAETNDDNHPQLTATGKILILRVFDHTHRSLYPVILRWLAKFPAIRHVTVHSEFGAYSGIQHFILLIPFLALIKLTGRRITYFAHNVIDSIDFLALHLDITRPATIDLLNIGIHLYHRLLNIVTDKIVVLDFHGKKILEPFVSKDKLLYIPHWVKKRSLQWTQRRAKQTLGIPVSKKLILSFGFITWYKGSDILAELFTRENKLLGQCQLIFAGGKAPTRELEPHYRTYYDEFCRLVEKQPNITVTGFIPEEKLSIYFAAADLVVLPYRGLMGGSGALSWAIGYGKPFLLSTFMHRWLANPDVKRNMKTTQTKSKNILFELNHNGMNAVSRVITNKRKLRKLALFSKALGSSRDIHETCKTFYNDVYAQKSISAPRGLWRIIAPFILPTSP